MILDITNSLREFSWQPLMMGLIFYGISIVCLHCALYKIHMRKLFAHGKNSAHGKIKSRRKKKETPKEERKGIILSRKERNSFVKVTCTGRAPCWCPDFEQRSHHQTKTCHI